MTEEEVMRIVDRAAAAKGASLRSESSVRPTPACPSLPRLERGVRTGDWTEPELQHVSACVACQHSLSVIRRLAPLEQSDGREAKADTTEKSRI